MAAMVEKLIIAFVIISCYILNAASLSKYVFVHKRMQPTFVTSNVPILARYANLGMITKQSRSYQQYQTLSPRRTYFHRHLTELRISSQSISNASNNLLQLLYSSLLKWNSYSARLFSILISLVEPTIAGGLLSGGLHAITGKLIHKKLVYSSIFSLNILPRRSRPYGCIITPIYWQVRVVWL
jgi:hypothetical protein